MHTLSRIEFGIEDGLDAHGARRWRCVHGVLPVVCAVLCADSVKSINGLSTTDVLTSGLITSCCVKMEPESQGEVAKSRCIWLYGGARNPA